MRLSPPDIFYYDKSLPANVFLRQGYAPVSRTRAIFFGLGNDEYRPFFGLEICLRKILPQYTDAEKLNTRNKEDYANG